MTTTQGGATAASTLELIERSRSSLLEASHSRGVAERYLQSRLAAMRAAAALVSARSATPSAAGPRSLWALLPSVAPELTEWAEFFAVATAPPERPERLERPARLAVSAREADDLLRQAETFIGLVCRNLGMPVSPVHHDVLVPTAWA
jgi:hypothetical protein